MLWTGLVLGRRTQFQVVVVSRRMRQIRMLANRARLDAAGS